MSVAVNGKETGDNPCYDASVMAGVSVRKCVKVILRETESVSVQVSARVSVRTSEIADSSCHDVIGDVHWSVHDMNMSVSTKGHFDGASRDGNGGRMLMFFVQVVQVLGDRWRDFSRASRRLWEEGPAGLMTSVCIDGFLQNGNSNDGFCYGEYGDPMVTEIVWKHLSR